MKTHSNKEYIIHIYLDTPERFHYSGVNFTGIPRSAMIHEVYVSARRDDDEGQIFRISIRGSVLRVKDGSESVVAAEFKVSLDDLPEVVRNEVLTHLKRLNSLYDITPPESKDY